MPIDTTAIKSAAVRTPIPALAEPVVISEFWANRRVQLTQIEGVRCIDVRRYQTIDGRLQPTPRGIALAIHKLPALSAALVKAERKARALGFIKNGTAP